MNFTPKTEEECNTRTLLPAGEYGATVFEAADEKSKAGNDQIHLTLKVMASGGESNLVHDYLLDAMAGKLRHFCVSAGLMSEYEAGQLTARDCSGQDVRVRLAVEKDRDGKYADKNVVKDYLPPIVAQTAPSKNGSAEGAAKKAFIVEWNRFVGEFPQEADKRDEYWGKCFSGFFPGKNRTHLTDSDWEKFRVAVKGWDPINGWKRGSPVSTEKQFEEEDIPF